MKPRFRAKLINSLSGFKSANLIGTVSNEGAENLAIFSSVVHLGSSPALIGFIIRPNSVSRHTLENILETKHYTINQVSEQFWQAAHHTSARFTKEQNEFTQCNLSPAYIDGFTAPFVAESQLKYGLVLKEIIPIELNDTQLIIGEVTQVLCQASAIKADGYIDIESLKTVSLSGLDSYHSTNRLSRLSYAKTDHPPFRININGNT